VLRSTFFHLLDLKIDELKLAGQDLGLVFNFRLGASFGIAKLPNLKWKTQPKQLLGYLLIAFALPNLDENVYCCQIRC